MFRLENIPLALVLLFALAVGAYAGAATEIDPSRLVLMPASGEITGTEVYAIHHPVHAQAPCGEICDNVTMMARLPDELTSQPVSMILDPSLK